MRLPIAIVIPHSALEVPPEVAGRLALTEAQLFNEADAYADMLYDFRGQVLHWLRFPFARGILDVNRPEDPTLNRPGDGIVKYQTSYGAPVFLPGAEPDARLEQELIARYWQPWHADLAAVEADERVKLVIDAHTMAAVGPAYYDDPGALRPRVSVSNLGDGIGRVHPERKRISALPQVTQTLAQALGTSLASLPLFQPASAPVEMNSPFFGGWDLWLHGGERQPWCMVEVNRALYLGVQNGDSPALPPSEETIARVREQLWKGLVDTARQLGFLE